MCNTYLERVNNDIMAAYGSFPSLTISAELRTDAKCEHNDTREPRQGKVFHCWGNMPQFGKQIFYFLKTKVRFVYNNFSM